MSLVAARPCFLRRPTRVPLGVVAALTASLLVLTLVPASVVRANSWSPAPRLLQPHLYHTATLLGDGKVLVAGECFPRGSCVTAELYDPVLDRWSLTGSMTTGRWDHRAARLTDGRVLVAGGIAGDSTSDVVSSAEVYDPTLGQWAATGSMRTARVNHTMTLLGDGRVLVTGGSDGTAIVATAEIYDPDLGTWSPVDDMSTERSSHTATLLNDGRVLVAGGVKRFGEGFIALASAEIYDPVGGRWMAAADLGAPRTQHTAALLDDGRVFAATGLDNVQQVATAEIYDPGANRWSGTGSLTTPRIFHTMTRLADGRVFVTGGRRPASSDHTVATTEIYDPSQERWADAATMTTARDSHTATLLADGRVLAVGGLRNSVSLDSAEIYDSN